MKSQSKKYFHAYYARFFLKTAWRKRKIKIKQGYIIFKLHAKYQLYHYHLYSHKKCTNSKIFELYFTYINFVRSFCFSSY